MPASVIAVIGLILGPVGTISQTDFPITTSRLITATDTLIPSFGDALVLMPGNTYSSLAQFITVDSSDLTATTPIAFAQSNTKTNTVYLTNGSGSISGSGVYPAGLNADAMTRGTMTVAVNVGTPVGAGSPVYIRKVLNGAFPLGVVGGVEGVADGTNTVLMTNGIVFKTGLLSTDPQTGQISAQVTILNRLIP